MLYILPIFATAIIYAALAPKVPRSLRTADRQLTFQKAVELGSEERALNILENSTIDPSFKENWAIIKASELGMPILVARILDDPRVDPIADDYAALRLAGYSFNPRALRNYCAYDIDCPLAQASAYYAHLNGYGIRSTIMRILLSDPRVPALSSIRPQSNFAVPIHILLNEHIYDHVKRGDLNEFTKYMSQRSESYFYPFLLEWTCTAAPRHGHLHIFATLLGRLTTCSPFDRNKFRKLAELQDWISKMVLFMLVRDGSVLPMDIFEEICYQFVHASSRMSSRLLDK